jgi:hypothetical protein
VTGGGTAARTGTHDNYVVYLFHGVDYSTVSGFQSASVISTASLKCR